MQLFSRPLSYTHRPCFGPKTVCPRPDPKTHFSAKFICMGKSRAPPKGCCPVGTSARAARGHGRWRRWASRPRWRPLHPPGRLPGGSRRALGPRAGHASAWNSLWPTACSRPRARRRVTYPADHIGPTRRMVATDFPVHQPTRRITRNLPGGCGRPIFAKSPSLPGGWRRAPRVSECLEQPVADSLWPAAG